MKTQGSIRGRLLCRQGQEEPLIRPSRFFPVVVSWGGCKESSQAWGLSKMFVFSGFWSLEGQEQGLGGFGFPGGPSRRLTQGCLPTAAPHRVSAASFSLLRTPSGWIRATLMASFSLNYLFTESISKCGHILSYWLSGLPHTHFGGAHQSLPLPILAIEIFFFLTLLCSGFTISSIPLLRCPGGKERRGADPKGLIIQARACSGESEFSNIIGPGGPWWGREPHRGPSPCSRGLGAVGSWEDRPRQC